MFSGAVVASSQDGGAPPARSIIGADPMAVFGFHATPEGAAAREAVAVAHPRFGRAFRIEVPERLDKPHHANLSARNQTMIKKGETLVIRFALRSKDPDSVARVQLYLQDSYGGYRNLASQVFEAGPRWTEFRMAYETEQDFFRNELLINFFFGDDAQEAEIGGIEVLSLGKDPAKEALAMAMGGAVRSEDFDGSFAPIAEANRASGSLPDGFKEDSAWADVDVAYRQVESGAPGGGRALEVDVAAVRKGRVQFALTGVPAVGEGFLEVSLATQSRNHTPLAVELRQAGEPYRIYGSGEAPARPEWGTHTLLLPLPEEEDAGAMLLFAVERPGQVRLDDLRLRWRSSGELAGEASAEGNLLYSGSFPIGLTAPWAGGGNGAPENTYRADPDEPGPSGLPSLRITPFAEYGGRPVARITSPFAGRLGGTHTFSVWMKGSRAGQEVSLRMGPPDKDIYKAPFQRTVRLGTEWRRYTHTVDLPLSAEGFYIVRLNTHDAAPFWVDQAQVNSGTEAGPYERPASAMLAIEPEPNFGLWLSGKRELGVRFAAWGALPEAARLRVALHHTMGGELELPLQKLRHEADRSWQEGVFFVPEEAAGKLGSWRVRAVLEGSDGEVLSPPAEALVHRVRPPRFPDRLVPESGFGIHVFFSEPMTRLAKKLGFNWIRGNYLAAWSRIEPRPGEWNWEFVDSQLENAREAQLEILLYLGSVPRWASVAEDDWTSSWYRNTTAAPRRDKLEEWGNYARKVFERYGDTVHAWEPWNEPFLASFFVADEEGGRPVHADPELFVDLFEQTHQALSEAGRDGDCALIWNMGPHYGAPELQFDRTLIEGGILRFVDKLSVHKYTGVPLGEPGNEADTMVDAVRNLLPPDAAELPIWNTEGGKGPSDYVNLYEAYPPRVDASQALRQADEAVRYFVGNFAAGIQKVFLYSYFLNDGFKRSYNYFNVGADLSATAPALSNLAWMLEGRVFAGRSAGSTPGTWVCLFEGDDRSTLVFLPGPSGVSAPARPGLDAYDLFGNPLEQTEANFIFYLEGATDSIRAQFDTYKTNPQ